MSAYRKCDPDRSQEYIMSGSCALNVWNQVAPVASLSDEKPKYRCEWCGGRTFDDDRGHCVACGGPRTRSGAQDMYLNSGYALWVLSE